MGQTRESVATPGDLSRRWIELHNRHDADGLLPLVRGSIPLKRAEMEPLFGSALRAPSSGHGGSRADSGRSPTGMGHGPDHQRDRRRGDDAERDRPGQRGRRNLVPMQTALVDEGGRRDRGHARDRTDQHGRSGTVRWHHAHMDNLVAQCSEAIADPDPIGAVRDVLRRAVSTGRLAESLPPPEPGLNVLFNDADLTILNVVWPPNFTLFPHNHLMWAGLCIYGGREDNTFFRRQDDGLALSGGKELFEGDVQMLGADVIHSVRNPGSSHTGAIHVYGGDFFAVERSQWDAETLKEQPYDINSVNRAFASAEQAFTSKQR